MAIGGQAWCLRPCTGGTARRARHGAGHERVLEERERGQSRFELVGEDLDARPTRGEIPKTPEGRSERRGLVTDGYIGPYGVGGPPPADHTLSSGLAAPRGYKFCRPGSWTAKPPPRCVR